MTGRFIIDYVQVEVNIIIKVFRSIIQEHFDPLRLDVQVCHDKYELKKQSRMKKWKSS
jgi:hypothetical protein